jgi:hypothetical protein
MFDDVARIGIEIEIRHPKNPNVVYYKGNRRRQQS